MNYPQVVLLACYELGHQPLSIAWPTAYLRDAGIRVRAVDLFIDSIPEEAVSHAPIVGISVPMHTAMRLGIKAAHRVRNINPDAHIAFFGYYAQLNAGYLLEKADEDGRRLADSVFSGEFERDLVDYFRRLLEDSPKDLEPASHQKIEPAFPSLERLSFMLPDRSDLPPLRKYAHYVDNGTAKEAGYTEASRGCLHTCLHCPVVPIYKGRFFIVPRDKVLDDIRQQVVVGAKHITFGDPDFLNGPGHALKIARELNSRFPGISFDYTTKVEHIIEQPEVVAELKHLGATFLTSAFESTSDLVLERLHKGHTFKDMEEAMSILRAIDMPIRPTWVAFTPWTTLDDYLEMLTWVNSQQLVGSTPTVQYSIRLLIPPSSALLESSETAHWLGQLQPDELVYSWRHSDSSMDVLQKEVAAVAEMVGDDLIAGYKQTLSAARRMKGDRDYEPVRITSLSTSPPRLTEDWFC